MYELTRRLQNAHTSVALPVAMFMSTWSAPSHATDISYTPPEEKQGSMAAPLRPRVQSPIFARYTYSPPAETQGDIPATLDSHTAEAALIVPLYRGDTVGLLVGAGYRFDRFTLDIAEGDLPLVDDTFTFDLHRIPVNAMVDLRLGDRWAVLASGGVSIAGDFKASDEDVVQPLGLLLATYALNERHALTLGGGLSYQFFDLLPFPILGYTYTSESKVFRLDAMLPIAARATLNVGWELDVSLYGRFEGLVWQVEAANTSENFLYKMQDARAGLSLRRNLVGPVGITLDGGAHLWRRLSLRTDPETQRDIDVEPSPYFSVSVDVKPK